MESGTSLWCSQEPDNRKNVTSTKQANHFCTEVTKHHAIQDVEGVSDYLQSCLTLDTK
jgi:hypothetical protein